MAKLRHIALIVPDPEKAAKFFEEVSVVSGHFLRAIGRHESR